VLRTSVRHWNKIHELASVSLVHCKSITIPLPDRARRNGHKMKHRRYPLTTRKHFFAVRVTEHLHRLPREVVESPWVEILGSCLVRGLGNWRFTESQNSRGWKGPLWVI